MRATAFAGVLHTITPEQVPGDLPYYRGVIRTHLGQDTPVQLSGLSQLFVLRDGGNLSPAGPLRNRLVASGNSHPELGQTEQIPLDQVLTVVTGITLVETTEEFKNIFSHILGIPSDQLEPTDVKQRGYAVHRWILRQYPELARLDTSGISQHTWRQWLATQRERLQCDTLQIVPMVQRPSRILVNPTPEGIETRLRELRQDDL